MRGQPSSLEERLAAHALTAESARGLPAEPVDVGERVLGRLHDQLGLWFGPDGFQSLLARAISRCEAEHHVVGEVMAKATEGRHLDAIRNRTPPVPQAEIHAALVALIATIFSILSRLVGDDLVTRLVHRLWPVASTVEPDTSGMRTPTRD